MAPGLFAEPGKSMAMNSNVRRVPMGCNEQDGPERQPP